MRHLNIIGPQVRRLRNKREWSQNDFAIKLQLLGMEEATRCKVSKIESRLVWVSDDDLLYLSRTLGVPVEELYPDFIRSAKKLYEAIAASKASRFGSLVVGFGMGLSMGLSSCTQLGAGALHVASKVVLL